MGEIAEAILSLFLPLVWRRLSWERGVVRRGLGGACQHAKLFEQLRLAAQGHPGDLEILRRPSVQSSQGGILFTGGLFAAPLAASCPWLAVS